jgi:hypothetical protein
MELFGLEDFAHHSGLQGTCIPKSPKRHLEPASCSDVPRAKLGVIASFASPNSVLVRSQAVTLFVLSACEETTSRRTDRQRR